VKHKSTNLNDVSLATGYELEDRTDRLMANGHGGTQTRLPKGHLARRDRRETSLEN